MNVSKVYKIIMNKPTTHLLNKIKNFSTVFVVVIKININKQAHSDDFIDEIIVQYFFLKKKTHKQKLGQSN